MVIYSIESAFDGQIIWIEAFYQKQKRLVKKFVN